MLQRLFQNKNNSKKKKNVNYCRKYTNIQYSH